MLAKPGTGRSAGRTQLTDAEVAASDASVEARQLAEAQLAASRGVDLHPDLELPKAKA